MRSRASGAYGRKGREMPGAIELTQAANKLGKYRPQNMPRTLDGTGESG